MRRLAIALALVAALVSPVARGAEAEAGAGEEESSGEAAEAASPAADPETAGAPADAKPAEASGEEEAQAEEEPAASEEEAEAEEEEEPSWFAEYGQSVRTRALTGLNGLATAPADPVMATVDTPKAFAKAGYLRRPLAFGSGVLLMLYRVFSGAVDLGFAVFPELPVVSPVPRYKLVPGFQHADE